MPSSSSRPAPVSPAEVGPFTRVQQPQLHAARGRPRSGRAVLTGPTGALVPDAPVWTRIETFQTALDVAAVSRAQAPTLTDDKVDPSARARAGNSESASRSSKDLTEDQEDELTGGITASSR